MADRRLHRIHSEGVSAVAHPISVKQERIEHDPENELRPLLSPLLSPAALDSVTGRQVMELFARVAHEHGTSVIVVTHDQRALNVFDTIYEMEDGLMRLKQTAVLSE